MRVIVAIASFTRGFATPSSDLAAGILIEPRWVIGARCPLGELSQVRFDAIELLGSYLRCPAAAHLVKERRADRQHFVAARRHVQPLEAPVAWVGLPFHVSELLQDSDRLRSCLLGNRKPAAEFRGGVRSRTDGFDSERMRSADTFVSALRQLSDHLVGHRVEAAEQKQRQLSAWGPRHEGIIWDLPRVDKMLVYL